MSRAVEVQSARDLGPQFVDNPHRMVGQDGAFSFPLRDGSSFWFFGDTLIGRRVPDQSPWLIDGKMVDHRDMSGQGTYEQMINNTGLILPPQSGSERLRDYRYITEPDGRLKALLPLEREEHPDLVRMWCQHGIALDDSVILSFIKVRMLERNDTPLPIGFEILGSGLAVGSSRDWRFGRVRVNDDDLLWKARDPHFAAAFLRRRDDRHVYLYGAVSRDGKQQVFLARTPQERLAAGDSFEYLIDAAPRWSADISRAIPLFFDMPSELSVAWNGHLNGYLAVHSLLLSGQIVARTASEPWGPWSEPVVLWQAKVTHPYPLPYAFPLIYAGKEHPPLSPDGGRTIYLTYIEFEEYFPHLLEVRLR